MVSPHGGSWLVLLYGQLYKCLDQGPGEMHLDYGVTFVHLRLGCHFAKKGTGTYNRQTSLRGFTPIVVRVLRDPPDKGREDSVTGNCYVIS